MDLVVGENVVVDGNTAVRSPTSTQVRSSDRNFRIADRVPGDLGRWIRAHQKHTGRRGGIRCHAIPVAGDDVRTDLCTCTAANGDPVRGDGGVVPGPGDGVAGHDRIGAGFIDDDPALLVIIDRVVGDRDGLPER